MPLMWARRGGQRGPLHLVPRSGLGVVSPRTSVRAVPHGSKSRAGGERLCHLRESAFLHGSLAHGGHMNTRQANAWLTRAMRRSCKASRPLKAEDSDEDGEDRTQKMKKSLEIVLKRFRKMTLIKKMLSHSFITQSLLLKVRFRLIFSYPFSFDCELQNFFI